MLKLTSSILNDILPIIDYILELFKAKKEEFKDNLIIGPYIDSG